MKHKLIITLLIFCVLSQCDIVAGYESTEQEEERAHIGSENDAFLTSRAEEVAHVQNVDDASVTENQEELERVGNVDDTYTTAAAERAERS